LLSYFNPTFLDAGLSWLMKRSDKARALVGHETYRAILTGRSRQNDINLLGFGWYVTPHVKGGISVGGAIYSMK
jgi:hypothetical protein